ncbi:MAG TPA: hypothetical protein VF476_13450 [Chitinophagaceae bacterium]
MASKKKTAKKKGKYDITVKSNLTPDKLFKLVINIPVKKKKK